MNFKEKILTINEEPLYSDSIDILQVNLGYACNMGCKHCHVDAGPLRTEVMDSRNIAEVLGVLQQGLIKVLDITGGAPELNPGFRSLVEKAQDTGCHIIVRSNLTIFFEQGMKDLFDFYDRYPVEITASLPYYREAETDRIRGTGSFKKSIRALQKLNSLGYGISAAERRLNIVYNPQGAFVPSLQSELEAEYRQELKKHFDISFHRLYTFTNMPVGRFSQYLLRSGNFEKYVNKLVDSFNPETLSGLMCRRLINVGWDGNLYDCDFNQMTGLGLCEGYPRTISDFDYNLLSKRRIATDDHCYGCTAGQGST